MRGAEDHESIQTFLTDGLHEPLNVGIRVGSAVRVADGLHLLQFESLNKLLREPGVPVMLHQADRQLPFPGLLDEGFGLRHNPGFVRM